MAPLLLLAAALSSPSAPASGPAPASAVTDRPVLSATELGRLPAEEARQGATASHGRVYAIGNHEIGRYDARSGKRVAAWSGDPVRYPHINSCEVDGRELVCAASNYPQVPMRSEVLWFDAKTLKFLRSQSLGHGHGSLTWLSRHDGAWYACYANYDAKGGEPGRDHRSPRWSGSTTGSPKPGHGRSRRTCWNALRRAVPPAVRGGATGCSTSPGMIGPRPM